MCSAPNVYMFVYTLIGAQIVPLKGYCNKDDCTFVFNKKIVQEKEIKLKEFNYKLLYGILPCNKNLMK